MEKELSQSKQRNFWTISEVEELTKTLAVICEGQKAYGKEVNLRAVYDYFKLKLESRFSAAQILAAIDVYTDKNNDVPAPADLIKILAPEKPLITEAQFVQACKAQERNGFPAFSAEDTIIREYRKQNEEAQDKHKTAQIENAAVKQIASGGLKMVRHD